MAEKTEEATPKRRREAREEGNVAKSGEFTGAMVMVAAAAALGLWMSEIVARLIGLMKQTIEYASARDLQASDVGPFLEGAVWEMAWMLLPVLAVAFAAAVFFSYVQIGAVFSIDPLIPKLERINIGQGLKNQLDPKKLVDLAKNIGKLSVSGVVGYFVVRDKLAVLVRLPRFELAEALAVLGSLTLHLAAYLGGVLIVFGVIDLIWQRHKHKKELMMTKDEVKREHKNTEGDPHIKSKRKKAHRELIQETGIQNVEDADAVVVNPTHVAVALRYDADQMNAPEVVSAGRGELARKIKRRARRYGITIVRNVELAHALVDFDIDQQIPEEFYEPVAEVLNYVYQLRQEEEEP
ncbi:MAG: EscU/YscU/HrcU family type III secretion system export apparatus switch protein [Persicimonas sp.]